jgi:hypothetical protein
MCLTPLETRIACTGERWITSPLHSAYTVVGWWETVGVAWIYGMGSYLAKTGCVQNPGLKYGDKPAPRHSHSAEQLTDTWVLRVLAKVKAVVVALGSLSPESDGSCISHHWSYCHHSPGDPYTFKAQKQINTPSEAPLPPNHKTQLEDATGMN